MDAEASGAGTGIKPETRVCPDCGGPAGAQPFCASCGRNLSMIERLPTRAEWERDGASATPARPEETNLPTKVAGALASIRTWYVPLDRSRSVQDSAVQARLKLSVQDHVAEAIELDAHKEMPIDIAISVEDDKRAYLAASVAMSSEKAIEQRFAASIERARGDVKVHPIGSINLVGAEGDVITSFAARGRDARPEQPTSSNSTLASEHVIINAPMSYAGSAQRIIRLRRHADGGGKLVAITFLAIVLILVVWVFVTAWYLVWGLWLVPYRLLRRGARKRKAEALRHRELMSTVHGSATESAAAIVAATSASAVPVRPAVPSSDEPWPTSSVTGPSPSCVSICSQVGSLRRSLRSGLNRCIGREREPISMSSGSTFPERRDRAVIEQLDWGRDDWT